MPILMISFSHLQPQPPQGQSISVEYTQQETELVQ